MDLIGPDESSLRHLAAFHRPFVLDESLSLVFTVNLCAVRIGRYVLYLFRILLCIGSMSKIMKDTDERRMQW